jgi:hypothetical protein
MAIQKKYIAWSPAPNFLSGKGIEMDFFGYTLSPGDDYLRPVL